MFTFVFEDVLFRFQYDNPAFAVLFQLPPKWANTHPIPLCKTSVGDFGPPNPLKEVF